MKKRNRKLRNVTLVLAALLVISAITAGGVFAYLRTVSDPVENDFVLAPEKDPLIEESFDENVKKDVCVKVDDIGYAVYVRAAIIITWKDGENGNVLGQPPVKDTDYEISLNTTDWFEHEGFYYYKAPVNSGNETESLIEIVQPIVTAPEGYGLNVEIIAQTIQAAGKTDDTEIPAVTDAWGVVINDGKLAPPAP